MHARLIFIASVSIVSYAYGTQQWYQSHFIMLLALFIFVKLFMSLKVANRNIHDNFMTLSIVV